LRIALFGFPLTGKTTLFRLLTGVEPPAHAGRGEITVGVTRVPDPRLDRLSAMYKPKKHTPATIEYMDLAGVEKGEAAKSLPLDQLRTADALAHVVRAFEDDAVPHSEGSIDPARDAATMETELILADHTIAERRLEKLSQLAAKTGKDEDKVELALIEKVVDHLSREIPLRNVAFDERELQRLRGYTFLSLKPLLVVVNAGEGGASKLDGGAESFGLAETAKRPATEVVALSAKIEQEIAQLDPDDAAAFRQDLGIREPALDRMIRASYRLLGRISFFTVGEDECRAWTVRRATPARAAAGTIHSDLEKGFIRAEVIPYDALIEAGSWAQAKDRGKLRLEGKEYAVQDGDILHVRFNV
jgi:GTP-binding protein YchF